MPLHPSLVFLGGLVVIVAGAEMLLRGAARLAALAGVRPLVIGLTIVSVGTSAPELAVGIAAGAAGRSTLAVGNIAGTNIFNILFILGLSALMRPLPLHQMSIRLDVPVMIASALLLIAMSWDGVLGLLDGVVLVAGGVGYTVALIVVSRRESAAVREEFAEEFGKAAALRPPGGPLPRSGAALWAWNITLLVVGIALTVVGAELMVSGAASLARKLGVSDALIGLTIVAIGTSAPELATTVLATLRNDRDVAIGNLIGSSTYNILVILGLTCVIPTGTVLVSPDVLRIDLPLAALVAIACLPVFRTGSLVSRSEGALFVAAYLAYLGVLIFARS